MSTVNTLDRHVVGHLLAAMGVDAWGVAGNVPRLPRAAELPTAISFMVKIAPEALHGLVSGPTPAYLEEYHRLNLRLDAAADALVEELQAHGQHALPVRSTRDKAMPGDPEDDGLGTWFSHKTAATQAGLGWIGKTALFVSTEFGPAVRLATVFTDSKLPPGEAITSGRCGACRACVDACPAGCGRDVTWQAGMPRSELFDAAACHLHMREQTLTTDGCGICIAACPLAHELPAAPAK